MISSDDFYGIAQPKAHLRVILSSALAELIDSIVDAFDDLRTFAMALRAVRPVVDNRLLKADSECEVDGKKKR